MELCTRQVVSNPRLSVSGQRFLPAGSGNLLGFRTILPLKPFSVSCGLRSRRSQPVVFIPRATFSEEPTSGFSSIGGTERGDGDGMVTVEDVKPVEKNGLGDSTINDFTKADSAVEGETQSMELLENLKLDDVYSYLPYGGGAIVVLYLATALIGAIDSIPLFPKLMEVVGLGYTFWFTTRYLLFKKNREEFVAKVEEVKKEVLGSNEN